MRETQYASRLDRKDVRQTEADVGELENESVCVCMHEGAFVVCIRSLHPSSPWIWDGMNLWNDILNFLQIFVEKVIVQLQIGRRRNRKRQRERCIVCKYACSFVYAGITADGSLCPETLVTDLLGKKMRFNLARKLFGMKIKLFRTLRTFTEPPSRSFFRNTSLPSTAPAAAVQHHARLRRETSSCLWGLLGV